MTYCTDFVVSWKVHVIFTLSRRSCTLVCINNTPIPTATSVRYLGLHLDSVYRFPIPLSPKSPLKSISHYTKHFWSLYIRHEGQQNHQTSSILQLSKPKLINYVPFYVSNQPYRLTSRYLLLSTLSHLASPPSMTLSKEIPILQPSRFYQYPAQKPLETSEADGSFITLK